MTATPAAPLLQITPTFETALQDRVEGEVRFDRGSRATYAVDSSNYREVPIAVVTPKSPNDAVAAVAVCAEYGMPVVSRGGGTSLGGQTTNTAVVLDWTKHVNRLVSLDVEGRSCVVEPGIALDDLNRQLAPHGLMYGPKPATHRTCTIGGMIGNNSCGSTAQAYGKTVDNLTRLEVLTYDGLRHVGRTDHRRGVRRNRRGRRSAGPYLPNPSRPPRRPSGSDPHPLPEDPAAGFGLQPGLAASREPFRPGPGFGRIRGHPGDCAARRVDLVEVPKAKAMVVLGYSDIAAAGDAVMKIVAHQPWQLEGLDHVLLQLEKRAHLAGDAIEQMPRGGGWLMVQFTGRNQEEADAQAQALIDDLEGTEHDPAFKFLHDPAEEERLVEVREAGLGATAHPVGQHDNWPGWEDSAVPPERLGDYLRDLRSLLDQFGFEKDETSLCGHFGQGCIHTRIPFELRTADGVAHFRAFAEAAADLVASYGGSLSGEHGDGQARGELLPRMFGTEVVELFGAVKALLDPDDRMNPGKVVAPNPLDGQLRLGAHYSHAEPRTHFSYPDDDGQFSKATLRCVGIGTCRNSVSDDQVMCPSYMVTREEEHSTRGRARLLFEMLRGETITDGWRSTEVRDALDLCLACKGCKSDCPVNVDMATYKAEFLSHHYAGRLRPMAHYSMGWLPLLAQVASPLAGPVNLVTGISPVVSLLKRLGGIASERDIPVFARRSFTRSWANRPTTGPTGSSAPNGPVILWPDTFTNNFHPGIARAAVEVLTDAGFDVRVPTAPVCCGLTWVSTGQLGMAKRVLNRTLRILRDDIRDGVPVVGLEPSCTAMLSSDGPELMGGNEDMRRLGSQTRTLAQLLAERAPDWRPPSLTSKPSSRPTVTSTRCSGPKPRPL